MLSALLFAFARAIERHVIDAMMLSFRRCAFLPDAASLITLLSRSVAYAAMRFRADYFLYFDMPRADVAVIFRYCAPFF